MKRIMLFACFLVLATPLWAQSAGAVRLISGSPDVLDGSFRVDGLSDIFAPTIAIVVYPSSWSQSAKDWFDAHITGSPEFADGTIEKLDFHTFAVAFGANRAILNVANQDQTDNPLEKFAGRGMEIRVYPSLGNGLVLLIWPH